MLMLMLSVYAVSWAKEKPKLKVTYRADKLEGIEKENESYKRLIGNVVFIHKGMTIKADSAQYYDQQGMVEAYGHVEIIDQEGAVIVADQLLYDTNKQVAQLRDSIVYQSDSVTCYTDQLDYDVHAQKGCFFNGGTLIEGENILSSKSGCYDEITKSATFYDNVQLQNKAYKVQCDALAYNTITKIATFQGNTTIINPEGDILSTTQGGEYNTSNKHSTFQQSKIESATYTLSADVLRANQTQDYYEAMGQVRLFVKKQNITISSDHSQYWKEKGIVTVYGNTLLEHVLDADTLYMTADTLKAIEGKQGTSHNDDTILAYNNVKIFKSDMQGKADSMAYHSIDSTIYFYNNPVFWSHNNQITAEGIQIVLNDQALDKMYVAPNAFIAAQDTLGNYNQLKGREMVAYFQDNKMAYIDIMGNGESLYFAIGDSLQLVGMNYLRCSHMRIDMDDANLSKISFFVQPTGLFYPPPKITEADKQLADFTWRIMERPTREEVLAHGYGTKPRYQAFKFTEKSP